MLQRCGDDPVDSLGYTDFHRPKMAYVLLRALLTACVVNEPDYQADITGRTILSEGWTRRCAMFFGVVWSEKQYVCPCSEQQSTAESPIER